MSGCDERQVRYTRLIGQELMPDIFGMRREMLPHRFVDKKSSYISRRVCHRRGLTLQRIASSKLVACNQCLAATIDYHKRGWQKNLRTTPTRWDCYARFPLSFAH
ncbi:hypothetical protein H0G86_012113 [Trichoderma simmonsii]|uniref:Uncharacterized protein n=1 Tax=Trichoderma simmonsii TaxID=1491479 RepID=A0A8G0LMX0_9HYPO|nr:hypothetical protein H0G86_012113 [Trichoderma simmonsii]